MNVHSTHRSPTLKKLSIQAALRVDSDSKESAEIADTFEQSDYSATGEQIYPDWLAKRPVSKKLALWSGLGFSAAGAVTGNLTFGPTGGLIGAAVGLACGGWLGKAIGDTAYSNTTPPTRHIPPTLPPAKAQKAVNVALQEAYPANDKATSAMNLIKGVVKAAVSNISAEDMQKRMRAKYQTMRLMDDQGQWTVPELKANSKALLPAELSHDEVGGFIDKMAEVASENDYLMKFLGKARLEDFPALRKKVASEGAAVLGDVIATAQVLDRLTSAMADDWKVNDGCRQVWKKVADTDPDFWAVQSIFEKAKTMSVNVGVQNVIDDVKIGQLNPNTGKFVLPLNILEAAAVDKHQAIFGDPEVREGHLANAQVGLELARHGPQGAGPATLNSEGKLVEIRPKAVEEWDNLYATWNMDFVTAYPDWPQIITKLVVPSVNDIKNDPTTYLNRRAAALQATLYLVFLSRVDGTAPNMDWRDAKLSQLWGLTNLESSKEYAQTAKSA